MLPKFSHRARLALAATLVACAPSATGSGSAPGPSPLPSGESNTDQPWGIKTREHVDLWLHGFAMLHNDTTLIPFFRRGYRDQLIVARNSANATTRLDTDRERLRARFEQNRSLVNAQFVALYFSSTEELRQAIGYFLQAEGQPQAANSRELASVIALLAGYFPAAADREWLRQFWAALSDESTRFYHDYWMREQRARSGALAAVDSLWQGTVRPQISRFLANSQQGNGTVMLSLPLDGEGRTLHIGKAAITAVTFPERSDNARDAIYVIVHELVGAVTNPAVADNLTPAEQRSGLLDRYTSNAAIRGGALLLQRLAPSLVDGYARYYLRAANKSVGSSPVATLASAFPLTEDIRAAVARQLEIVLGGI